MKSKILIISAGSMVSQNIMETLKHRRKNLFIVGTDASANAPVYDYDKIYLTPLSELPPSPYADVLTEIIKKESPDIVIPGRDIDIITLAMLKEKFPNMAGRFITGTAELGQMMEDKWTSFTFADKEGLPFADSIICDFKNNKKEVDLFIEKHGFPLLVKPRKGFASKGVFFVLDKDLLAEISSDCEMVIQEYLGNGEKIIDFHNSILRQGLPLFYSLEDVKYSMQLFIGPSGELKGSMVTEHNMKSGVSAGVSICKEQGLDELIDQYYTVFSGKGWYGPLNIQMQKAKNNGGLKAYEFNGRYTGATAARYVLGYDEVGFALDLLPSRDIDNDGFFSSQKNALKQTFISERPEKHMAVLNKNKQWVR